MKGWQFFKLHVQMVSQPQAMSLALSFALKIQLTFKFINDDLQITDSTYLTLVISIFTRISCLIHRFFCFVHIFTAQFKGND